MYPGNGEYLVDAYEQCVEKKFGYLLIDCHSETPKEFRLRSNFLPVSFYHIVSNVDRPTAFTKSIFRVKKYAYIFPNKRKLKNKVQRFLFVTISV
jgi:hypothetical protein